MRRNQPEQQIQRALIQHIKARGVPDLFWFAVPNGGYRHPIEAKNLKATGVRAGVPDLCFLHNSKFYGLELKTEKGRASAHQLDRLTEISRAGGSVCIAYGLDAALQALETWELLRTTTGAA
jgi:hypothetical protein